jgi:soluble lytic murein transglycosylase-like protein
MADALAELEDALGITATPTPTPNFTPTSTPQPELSFLERMRQSSYGIPQPFRALGDIGLSVIENPRVIPEEGASIAGSIVGGAAGTVLGGPVGSILGGALGSYADVPVQMGLDYLLGTTPTSSRLSQATQEAELGAVIETGLRGAGALGRTVAPIAKKATGLVSRFVGPSTEEAAQRLVGQELAKAITPQKLIQAATEKEALGSVGQSLTTADVTGSKQLARMQELLSGQDLGQANITFAETAAKQLDDLDQAALNMSALKDPNPKRAGEAARELLEKAREAQNASAGGKFTSDLREIAAPSVGLRKAATEEVDRIYKGSDVLGPSGELESLVEKIKALDAAPKKQKTPAGFGRQAAEPTAKLTKTNVGALQDLRSQALELSRSATRGSRDELLADRLSEMLAKKIDEVPGTERLKDAQRSWREYKQRWFRSEDGQLSPLAKLLRKQNPEDIITSVSKKSAVADEYAKVLGGLEPNKLATEMADFVQQQTVDKKLKWLRSKRAVFVDSPIAPVLQQWEDALAKIQNTAEAADVKGLSAQNIDTQATSLIRALGGTGKEAIASGAEASALSAMRNVGRSGITSALGGKLAGVTAGVGERLLSGTIQESTGRTASALAQALSDPSTALKYINDAAIYGKEEAARIALQDQQINQAMSLVQSLTPQAAAVSRGAGLFTPRFQTEQPVVVPTASPTMSQTEASQLDALDELKAALGDFTAEPTPEPTPQPETVQVGKQNVSIPTGEEYSEPRLVKAVIGAESTFNPKAVSPVGAAGLMQLMPATAKDLGLTSEQRFDPDKNVEAGSRYLKQLEDEFGDKKVALAAYNWGMGNVSKAVKKLKAEGEPVTWENIKSVTRVPSETREYVKKVMLLRKYDDFDLAKIAVKVGEVKLDEVLSKYKTAGKFTVGDVLDDLGIDAKDVRVKRGNVLQAANNLIEA